MQRRSKIREKEVESEGKLRTAMGRLEKSSPIPPRWKGGNRLEHARTGAGGRREVGEVGEFEPVRSQQRVGEILRGAGSQ